jgi:hypothetical protein
MAIYHLSIKTGNKGKGASAGAKDEYIEREGKYEKKRGDVLIKESGNMPYWAEKKPSSYWKTADVYERANGRLYKELEFSLPVELSDRDKIDVARDFASYLTKGENLPYTLAIHKNDPNNPHCHMIISERVNDDEKRPRVRWFSRFNRESPQKGGARKTEALKSEQWFNDTIEKWAVFANHYLEEAGHYDVKIDHRSLEAQGIDRPKPVHLGMAAWQMEKDRLNKKGEVTRGAILTERGNMKREAEDVFQAKKEYSKLGEHIKNEEIKIGKATDDMPKFETSEQEALEQKSEIHEAEEKGAEEYLSEFEASEIGETEREMQEMIERGVSEYMAEFEEWEKGNEAEKGRILKEARIRDEDKKPQKIDRGGYGR